MCPPILMSLFLTSHLLYLGLEFVFYFVQIFNDIFVSSILLVIFYFLSVELMIRTNSMPLQFMLVMNWW